MPRTLELVRITGEWADRFHEEAARITDVLGRLALALEHVGSTAVPGIAGKPVLDVAIGVSDEAAANACIEPLTGLGYDYRGLNGSDPRRRYYTLTTGEVRSTQLHLYLLPAAGWDEKLRFRDALRADPALAAAYASEKYRVARLVGWDKGAYAVAKEPFVARVLAGWRPPAS
ncbi:MAG: GrpB family protein [Gemmatimonadaceae bacterium]|nr:GrpB family protein [Gemmatimonadaceae bacterium]